MYFQSRQSHWVNLCWFLSPAYFSLLAIFWQYLNWYSLNDTPSKTCAITLNLPNAVIFPDKIYLFKVNIRNTRKRCKICLTLTIKTPERRQKLTFLTPSYALVYPEVRNVSFWRCSVDFTVLNIFHTFF